jgi:hypothetical protein
VVTERDVRAAAKVGRLVLPAHAIVTPAARELARRLGVALESAERGATSGEHEMGRSQPGAGSRDHGGFHLKEALKPAIAELGCGVIDVGCYSPDSVDYPVFAAQVADRVACGDAQFGVMIDGAGLGSATTSPQPRTRVSITTRTY